MDYSTLYVFNVDPAVGAEEQPQSYNNVDNVDRGAIRHYNALMLVPLDGLLRTQAEQAREEKEGGRRELRIARHENVLMSCGLVRKRF